MRTSTRLRLAIGFAVVAFGLVSEWFAARQSFGWGDPARWLPDLITGLTVAGCGLLVWQQTSNSRAGLLMLALGVAWFAGNFTGLELGPFGQVGSAVVYLHRGPLAHLLFSYPTGKLSDPVDRAAIVVGYASILAPPALQNVTTLVFAALIVSVGVRRLSVSTGPERRSRRLAAQGAMAVAAALVAGAIGRVLVPAAELNDVALLGYELTLIGVLIGLLVALRRTSPESAQVTDLVVELGDQRGATLRDALASALGDPTLEIGYWLPEGNGYVDFAGKPVPSLIHADRRTTLVERSGEPLAVLIHDPTVLDDPRLVASVSRAATLGAVNVRLRGEVTRQLDDVRASRRRLLTAEQDERRRLAERLLNGADRTLLSLTDVLSRAHRAADAPSIHADHIERADALLTTARGQLGELAIGLDPRELTENGLASALTGLALRTPLPVSVEVDGTVPTALSPELERAAYFVCLEGLANIVKHASALQARIVIAGKGGRLTVAVADDGIGGADSSLGSGLIGLTDRVEALGGSLRVESPVGYGTRLVAELPLGSEAL